MKDINPKAGVGQRKAGLSDIPFTVLFEIGLAMREGSRKYRRHNYRAAGVTASDYLDALTRHIGGFWEGEDIDPDSGLSHVTKAITTLIVLRDSMIQGNWIDDRPPRTKNPDWLKELNKKASELVDKYPDGKPPYTEKEL